MLKAYKYRIYPTDEQKEHLNKCFGCVRLVYNLALETKIHAYRSFGVSLGKFELMKQLTELKSEYDFLYDCPNQCLQVAISNLDKAYQSFFKGGGFPKFKKKGTVQSLQFSSVHTITNNKFIKLPLIGNIPIYIHREFNGQIRTCTISKTPTEKYFISILVKDEKGIPEKLPFKNAVGIDVGLKTFAFTSDGEIFENQKYLTKALKQLRIEQRTMSRRFKKGVKADEQSNSYKKQRLVVAKLHERVTNLREYYLHSISSKLVRTYDVIIVETLNIKGMMQNRKLSKAIGEQGWYKFFEMLKYKCEEFGKTFHQIGQWESSSKTCHCCGEKNKELKLSHRVWECLKCHTVHDRDYNAAINIKNIGLAELLAKHKKAA